MGPVVGSPCAAFRWYEGPGAVPTSDCWRTELHLRGLWQSLQTEIITAKSPEVGVWQRAPVPVPLLRVSC